MDQKSCRQPTDWNLLTVIVLDELDCAFVGFSIHDQMRMISRRISSTHVDWVVVVTTVRTTNIHPIPFVIPPRASCRACSSS